MTTIKKLFQPELDALEAEYKRIEETADKSSPEYYEFLITRNQFKTLIDEKGDQDEKEATPLIQTFLKNRWKRIQNTNLAYPNSPNSTITKTCSNIAVKIIQSPNPITSPNTILMPTVNSKKIVNFQQITFNNFKLTELILSDDNTNFIPIADTLATLRPMASDDKDGNPQWSLSTLNYEGRSVNLTPNESKRLCKHSNHISNYFRTIRNSNVNETTLATLRNALKEDGIEVTATYPNSTQTLWQQMPFDTLKLIINEILAHDPLTDNDFRALASPLFYLTGETKNLFIATLNEKDITILTRLINNKTLYYFYFDNALKHLWASTPQKMQVKKSTAWCFYHALSNVRRNIPYRGEHELLIELTYRSALFMAQPTTEEDDLNRARCIELVNQLNHRNICGTLTGLFVCLVGFALITAIIAATQPVTFPLAAFFANEIVGMVGSIVAGVTVALGITCLIGSRSRNPNLKSLLFKPAAATAQTAEYRAVNTSDIPLEARTSLPSPNT